MARARRVLRAILRGFAWLVSGLVLLLGLVAAALWTWGDAIALRVGNGVLEPLFVGRVELRAVERVSLTGVAGVDAFVYTPEGALVGEIHDLSAQVNVLPLVWDALFGAGTLEVLIEAPQARHVRLDLAADDSGALHFLRALEPAPEEPPPPPDAPPARPVRITLEAGRLEHVWAHGTPAEDLPLDAEITGAGFDVLIEDEAIRVAVGDTRVELRRAGELPQARLTLDAKATIASVETDDWKQLLPTLEARGAVESGAVRVEFDARKEGLDARASVALSGFGPEEWRALGVDYTGTEPSTATVAISGELPTLDVNGNVSTEGGEAVLSGSVTLEPELAARLRLELLRGRAAVFVPGLDLRTERTELELEVAQKNDGWTGALRGTTGAIHLSGRTIPSLRLDGKLDEAGLDLRVEPERRGSDTSLTVHAPPLERWQEALRFDFSLRSSARDLRPLAPELPPGAEGTIRARGSYDVTREVLAARLELSVDDLEDPDGAYAVRGIEATIEAEGPVQNPSIDARVSVQSVAAADRRFESVVVRSRGTLSSSQARVTAKLPQGEILVRTNWGLRTGLDTSRLDVRYENKNHVLRLTTERFAVVDGRAEFEDLRIEGVGQLQLSGSVGPQRIRLVGFARDLDLNVVAELADLEGYDFGGKLDLDADWELTVRETRGRLTARLADFDPLPDRRAASAPSGAAAPPKGQTEGATSRASAAPKDPDREAPWSGTLDLLGRGRDLALVFAAETPATPKRSERSWKAEGHLELGGLSHLFDVDGWTNSWRSADLEGTVDLERVSQFLPKDTNVALTGRADFAVSAERTRSAPLTNLSLRLETEELEVLLVDPNDSAHLQSIRGIDAVVRFSHDSSEASSEFAVRLLHGGKTLARLRGKLDASLAELTRGDPVKTIRRAPLEATVQVPRRAFEAYPTLFGLPPFEGTLGGRLRLQGSLDAPRLELAVRGRSLRPPHSKVDPLDARLTATYDGAQIQADAWVRAQKEELVQLQATASYPWAQAQAGELPQKIDAELAVQRFPVDFIPALDHQGIRGRLSAKARASEIGTPSPRVEATVELEDFFVREVPLRGGVLEASVDEKQARLEARIDEKDWSLRVQGTTALEYEDPWSPAVIDPIQGDLEARRLPLVLLLPFMPTAIAELDGRLDAVGRATHGAGSTTIEASASLRDGKVQIPALGQQLHDVTADFSWGKDGRVRVENASLRGVTGRAEFWLDGRMAGVSPEELRLGLTVDRNDRMPLSLQGVGLGEFWGKIDSEAKFDAPKRTTTLTTRIEQLQVRFPEIPSASVQSLDPDETIQIGVFLNEEKFATLPLQPIEDEETTPGEPSIFRATFELGREVWVQQGPSRRIQLSGRVGVVIEDEVKIEGQIGLSRGRIDLNGRLFDIDEGTVTLVPEEPDNPVVMVEAHWTSPEGITVYARFVGPVKNGQLTLRSEPALSQGEILSLVLFGTTDGLNGVGTSRRAQPRGNRTASQAVAVGGGVATQGLNQALSRLSAVDVSTRINSDETGNTRPEVVVQLTNSLSAQLGYNLEQPVPGKNPDRTLLTLELRLAGGNSLATTWGDRGSSIFDWTWRYRY